jgi:hypothetical protein
VAAFRGKAKAHANHWFCGWFHLDVRVNQRIGLLRTIIDRRTILKLTFVCLIALTITGPATFAQTKRRSTKTSSSTAMVRSTAVNAGAIRVADQLKTLARFVYLLGGVAKGIEAADAAARRNEASPSVIDQINKSKATVKTSLQDIRIGLDKLELDFRSNSELSRYYLRLAGVAAGAAAAEQHAAQNQFDRAGRALLDVVNRLTDVLLEMR